ncbi:hypothetical protein GCM10028796_18680 [Ramlibacter monticola]|uniref:Uncharacterized protein n=1 Tax=Ramlibacter monticola TaxID=1926872 RepID=A0A937CT43_9BURK|nr:hypothetical protein [Ramlibacter monticola]MBL0392130.1 hypothetical protein [Ramlibacter monticola]
MWRSEMTEPAASAGGIRGMAPMVDAYDGWKDADAAARAIEREVKETWRRYERGVGAAPSKELLREAACLRHAAREKLMDVLGLLHAVGRMQPALRAVTA